VDVLEGLLPPHAVTISATMISAELPRKYEICR
jgi:hypothetical protein